MKAYEGKNFAFIRTSYWLLILYANYEGKLNFKQIIRRWTIIKIQVLQAPFALEIKLFSHRIGGQSTTELLEDLTINLTEHHGGMHLTTIEQW